MNNLLTTSLWRDEAFSAIIAQKGFLDIIRVSMNDTAPPLYYLLLSIWMKLFGNSEIVIRSLSVLFFLISLFFIYKLAELLFDKKTGAITVLVTALNPVLFHYAFEGRMYSLMLMAVVMSYLFFLKKKRVWYVVATTIALYSHYFSALILFPQFLYYLYQIFIDKKRDKNFFIYFMIAGLLYLPWLYPLYRQTQSVASGFWIEVPDWQAVIELIKNYLGMWRGHKLGLAAMALSLLTLGVRFWREKFGVSAFLLAWLLLPIATTWVISQFVPIFFNRYLIAVIPALALLIASQRSRIGSILIILLIFSLIKINYDLFNYPDRENFPAIAEQINNAPADLVINWHNSVYFWESKYYGLEAPMYIPKNKPLPFYLGAALLEDEDIITHIPKEVSRLAIITGEDFEGITGFSLIAQFSKDGIHVFWLEKE